MKEITEASASVGLLLATAVVPQPIGRETTECLDSVGGPLGTVNRSFSGILLGLRKTFILRASFFVK